MLAVVGACRLLCTMVLPGTLFGSRLYMLKCGRVQGDRCQNLRLFPLHQHHHLAYYPPPLHPRLSPPHPLVLQSQ
ncbi:hypothetical protein BDR05DRAFT_428164 [Suillus weaverae]|nr:hypothetical protein BDR05DRAFT_428164 [Suillus weaverae]